MWGGRPVVSLRHFRAVALFEDQLLLGQQVVCEDPVQLPDLVQQIKLAGRVVAQVSDQLADPGPVLLLDVGAVVAIARPGSRERDLLLGAVLQEVVVDELGAVILTMPMSA